MPEAQGLARIGQHACGTHLVHGLDQVGHALAEDGRKVRNGEVDAEQRGRPQGLTHLA